MTLEPGLPENIPNREKESIPYTFLVNFYQKTLSTQLQQELRINQSAMSHDGLDRHDKTLLRLRNLRIEQAKTTLEESKNSTVPEFAILKASAIYNHCPIPQTHGYINGETALTFPAEPNLISLTNLLKTVEPLATHKDANLQFVKYFANLKQKYSQVLLDESLNNGERRGLVGIKVKGGLRVTGIARDYLTPEGYRPKAIDQKKKDLQEVFTQDIKKFIRQHKDFGKGITPPTLSESKQDSFPEMTELEKKVTHKDYVVGADEIDEFIALTKDHVYFKPDQQLKQVQKLVDETRTLEFDTIRTKKVQQKLNIIATFANLLAMGGGMLNHSQSADALSHALQPDGDPMRQLNAMGNIVDLGHYFYDHRTEDPINTAVTYLEDPDHVRPIASYLLYDYFESLQHFPEADRPRLVEKATTFVNEVASRYKLPDDTNHDSLAEYLMATSEDPEMQDLLGYTVLPALAYIAENEDSYAREQWLDHANQLLINNHDDTLAKYEGDISENTTIQALADRYLLPAAEHLDSTERDNLLYWASMHFVNGDYEKLMPYLDKAFALMANYDPDKVVINFDNPDRVTSNGELITIPHAITEALNALPPNPHYLSPEQFLKTSESAYVQTWHDIYGSDSKPPEIYWDPVKVQPEFVSSNLRALLDGSLNTSSEESDRFDYMSDENTDWFTRSTVGLLNRNFTEIYGFISDEDPYKQKFQNSEGFLHYYQDYTNFIKGNGSPNNPIPESKLLSYALVKCNGNLSDATKEVALVYKFLARFDIQNGDKSGITMRASVTQNQDEIIYNENDKNFFRTIFMEENLPILLSTYSQTDRGQDLNQVTPLLEKLSPLLNDQWDKVGGSPRGLAIGANDLSLAEIWGYKYHRWGQLALVASDIANPSAVSIKHVSGEMPILFDDWTHFGPSENSSYKSSVLALSGMDNIEFRHLLHENMPIRKISAEDAGILPTIQTIRFYSENPVSSSVVNINAEISAVTMADPMNPTQPILYYGPPDLIKLYAEKGYAPANFTEHFSSDSTSSPELLEYLLSNGIKVSYFDSLLSSYAEGDQLKVAQILLDHGISILNMPDNLDDYLRLQLDVSETDIKTLIDNPDYYRNIENALPDLAVNGLVKPDHPLVKYVIENNDKTTFEYYSTLTPDGQFTLKQLYPDLEHKIQDYVIYTLSESNSDDKKIFNDEKIGQFFPILIQSLRSENREGAIKQLNYLLPYFTVDQLKTLIQNPHLEGSDFTILFDPGYILARNDRYPDLHNSLIKLESTTKDHPELLLSLAPALLKEKIWDIENGGDKIDTLIAQRLDLHEFGALNATFTFYYLQEQGYVPSPELANRLVEESMVHIKSQNTHPYSGGVNTILGHFATPDQFTIAMQYLVSLSQEDASGFANQIFYERFEQYATYMDKYAIPMNNQEQVLLNALVGDDTILAILGGESGLVGTYYGFTNYLTEANAHRIYEESLPSISERTRYQLIIDMQEHDFHPPQYTFNHDKFIDEIFEKYTSERWYIFDSSSNDFVKNNLTFTEYLDVLKLASEDQGIMGMYMSEDIDKVFNHDFFVTIPGYSPEQEQQLVTQMIKELSNMDKDQIPSDSYFLVPYLTSQSPEFDYGPYLVAWVNKQFSLKYDIEQNPETIRLFIEATKNIQAKYWDEIKANDSDKYEYLQQLIANYNQPDIQDRRR